MVENHAIKLAEGFDGGVNCFLGEREIRQIPVQNLDLLVVLLLQFLEGLDAASDHHHIVLLRCGEQVLGYSETDAWDNRCQ